MPCPGDPGPRPAFIPVPLAARAVMRYQIFSQIVENVFHFTQETNYTEGDLADLGDAIVSSWNGHIKPLLSTDVTLLDVICTAIDAPDGPQSTTESGAQGTNSGGGLDTLGSTLAIKFATGRSGRSFRGRMYWPQLLASDIANNDVSLVAAGAYIEAISNLMTDVFSSVGSKHVVVSYQHDCAWRTTGVGTLVTGYLVSDFHIDSQRRRLSGRGI